MEPGERLHAEPRPDSLLVPRTVSPRPQKITLSMRRPLRHYPRARSTPHCYTRRVPAAHASTLPAIPVESSIARPRLPPASPLTCRVTGPAMTLEAQSRGGETRTTTRLCTRGPSSHTALQTGDARRTQPSSTPPRSRPHSQPMRRRRDSHTSMPVPSREPSRPEPSNHHVSAPHCHP